MKTLNHNRIESIDPQTLKSMFDQLYFMLLAILCAFYPLKSTAQIIPDGTLGAENSTIRSIDDLQERIEGGAARGENLFHSFEQFAIQEGFTIEFANSKGIENIFSRVTGGDISKILGTLGVDGSANLFLMNPNGIVFGENAIIDVGGSFMATTAEEIDFNSGGFSATSPNKPQITIDFPIGLGFGSNPGDINVKGEQNNVQLEIPSFRVLAEELPQSIEVNSGENISLIGGSIKFDGGGLKAPQGNIDIAGVGGNQTLKLLPNSGWFTADLDSVSVTKNVTFGNAAYVDVSGDSAGNINIGGRNIVIDDGSVILADTSTPTDNAININAFELLEIKGSSGNNELNVFPNKQGLPANAFELDSNYYSISLISADVLSNFDSNGTGNNINVRAENLRIFDAGQIRTVSFSEFQNNQAGNIHVEAKNVIVEGTNNIDGFIGSVINSSTGQGTAGNSGNISLEASLLEVKNGGRIKADTFSSGNGGKLDIAAEEIFLESNQDEIAVPAVFRTGLSVSPGNKDGSGGAIDIDSRNLSIFRAEINNSSFSNGIPGDIVIDTEQLKVLDGGAIRAETASGSSASILINARDIELNGTRQNFTDFAGGISTSTRSNSKGNGGDINISTDSLEIFNGSIIRAISLGSGDAGNINVNARLIAISGVDRFAKNPIASSRVSKINTGATRGNGGNLRINSGSIELDNLGIINASSIAGDRGGNIDIDTSNLVVRGQSQIAASAGNDGNGGNININSNAILGIENSDIVANAVGGNGGNIVIDSDYILGLDSRSQLSALSDISASSELGLDGNIQIIDPKIFNGESIISFEQVDVNSSQKLISKSCFNNNKNNAGVVSNIGSGGMLENPENYFDREPLVEPQKSQLSQGDLEVQDWQWGDPIVEANIVKTMPDGTQYLASQTQLESVREKICEYST